MAEPWGLNKGTRLSRQGQLGTVTPEAAPWGDGSHQRLGCLQETLFQFQLCLTTPIRGQFLGAEPSTASPPQPPGRTATGHLTQVQMFQAKPKHFFLFFRLT